MKAKDLKKKSIPIEKIYRLIESANERNEFKVCVFHAIYVNNEIILQLIKDGFKVYRGDWDMMKNCLIIEW
jgi:hypothetical protein